MIAEAITLAGMFTIGLGIGRMVRDSKNEGGCNGHHWGDFQPTRNSSERDRRAAGYKSPRWMDHYNVELERRTRVLIEERGFKRCEDCGEYKKVTKKQKTVPIAKVLGA